MVELGPEPSGFVRSQPQAKWIYYLHSAILSRVGKYSAGLSRADLESTRLSRVDLDPARLSRVNMSEFGPSNLRVDWKSANPTYSALPAKKILQKTQIG